MALIKIDKIEREVKEKNYIHKETACTYTSFIGDDNKRYFQFDTYGSQDRKFPEKVSQSIQFDEETAKVLIGIMNKEFNS